ncbi:MAG: NAD(P)/FAD-dependent oxidoreductase [Acidobacteriaceae bacterium]
MARVVVIGAGPMGLAAAYQAVKDGHDVDLVEAAPEAGGMAGHFDFGSISLERFYHFVCRGDKPTEDLLLELGLGCKLHWVPTTMGFYFRGGIRDWGNPVALMRLKGLGLWNKLRYALFAYLCTKRKTWPALENRSAKDWIIRWCGQKTYDQLWRPLFDLKFFELADNISAAWMWTRMRRVGRSRKSMMQEELGYIEGGSKTLVDALVNAIEAGGGRLHLHAVALRVHSRAGRVVSVETGAGNFPADFVICTLPIPLVANLVPDLPMAVRQRYEAIRNIGICCVILKLKHQVSPHFWVNMSGLDFEIPGIIEFSNLRPLEDTVVYAPYYMPPTNRKWTWSDQQLIDHTMHCLMTLNPALTTADLVDAKVSRLRFAQPICEPGFASKLPPIQTPIEGLQIADTCFYYPEDRSIAESVLLGRRMANAISKSAATSSESLAHNFVLQ